MRNKIKTLINLFKGFDGFLESTQPIAKLRIQKFNDKLSVVNYSPASAQVLVWTIEK